MNSVSNEKYSRKDAFLENEEGEWSKEQEGMLKNLVNIYGRTEWKLISTNLNNSFPQRQKTDVECQKHWESLVPQVFGPKEPWSDREEVEMLVAHQKYNNKWSNISEELKCRDNNTIKNKFYSIFRKVKVKIQKNDLTYNSELEALETNYMLAIAVQYLSNPATATKPKGKRGKDFICSLVHNLNKAVVQEYKDKFDELTKDLGSIEVQLNTLAKKMNVAIEKAKPSNADENCQEKPESSPPENNPVIEEKKKSESNQVSQIEKQAPEPQLALW